jgi:ubiquitin-protein ligase
LENGQSIDYIVAFPIKTDNFLISLEAQINIPEGNIYAKGIFKLEIQVPKIYPFEPPNVKVVTPIYHPSIDNEGHIFLDILNLPTNSAWILSLNITIVWEGIDFLISKTNPDDGLICDISA